MSAKLDEALAALVDARLALASLEASLPEDSALGEEAQQQWEMLAKATYRLNVAAAQDRAGRAGVSP